MKPLLANPALLRSERSSFAPRRARRWFGRAFAISYPFISSRSYLAVMIRSIGVVGQDRKSCFPHQTTSLRPASRPALLPDIPLPIFPYQCWIVIAAIESLHPPDCGIRAAFISAFLRRRLRRLLLFLQFGQLLRVCGQQFLQDFGFGQRGQAQGLSPAAGGVGYVFGCMVLIFSFSSLSLPSCEVCI